MANFKNNHYVPQMLLRRFMNAKGELFYFNKNKPEKSIEHRNPNSIFCAPNLYVDIDRTKKRDVSLERDVYGTLESDATPIVDKIVEAARKDKLPQLTRVEKSKWDEFFARQWARTPDAYAKYSESFNFQNEIKSSLDFFKQNVRPISLAEHAKFGDPEYLKKLRKTTFIGSLKLSGGMSQHALGTRGLGIVRISDAKKSFIIGSFPVVKLTLPGRTKLTDPTVEAWLPISYDVAVTPWGLKDQEAGNIIDGTKVRELNLFVCAQSTEIAGRSEALLQSLLRGR
jgi:Protein of unknown function (DUF4238)